VHVILLIFGMLKLGDSTSFLDEYQLLGYEAIDFACGFTRPYGV